MPASLTLAPIPYHWSADAILDFYAAIADEAPVDTVYVGEVVCSKRAPFFEDRLPEAIERLERAGKRVVLSTLAEPVLKRERIMTAELCAAGDREIEINNAAGLWHVGDRPHRIGPFVNVYNESALRFLAGKGATHFALAAELPRVAIEKLAAEARTIGVGVEVQVYGRASLAMSARCYHARAHGRTRDNCQFACGDDADGMELRTLAGGNLLAINGVQTLSHGYLNLAGQCEALREIGVSHLRLMPQRTDMAAVAAIFAERVGGRIGGEEATARLSALTPAMAFINGFWHGVAGERFVA
jgi:collagenase-like PrtC family protease